MGQRLESLVKEAEELKERIRAGYLDESTYEMAQNIEAELKRLEKENHDSQEPSKIL